jgi:hypothetical protein
MSWTGFYAGLNVGALQLILSRHLPFDKFPDLRFDFPQVTRDLAAEILIYLYDLLLDLGDFPPKADSAGRQLQR